MNIVKIKLIGRTPTLMHSDRLANPFDPITKQLKALSGKRGKTEEDLLEIARVEWLGGMYYDEDLGPYIPGRNITSMLINAAKRSKEGKKVSAGLIINEDKIRLNYSGPRNPDEMWSDGRFTDIRTIKVQASRVARCRAIFCDWSLEFEVIYDPTVVEKTDIVKWAENAGKLIGLGDYRIEKSGTFGRFDVEVLN